MASQQFDLGALKHIHLPGLPSPIERAVKKLLLIDRMNDLYEKALAGEGPSIFDNILHALEVRYTVAAEDLARIPANGSLLVVANHPFGMLEGILLSAMLTRVRSDVRIMTNRLLAGFPELRPHCIFVDPFHFDGSRPFNMRALRDSVSCLRTGGVLLVFPSGEVSHWSFPNTEITDPSWSPHIVRLIRMSGADVLPVYVKGANSAGFQLLGLAHPWLRTASLPRELLNKSGQVIEVRIGTPVPSRMIQDMPEDRNAVHYLRWRTHLLAQRDTVQLRLVPRPAKTDATRAFRTVAAETPRATLANEVRELSADQCLERVGDYSTFIARAQEIPNILRELGRLREIAFRGVGEGTGSALDLDEFDFHYRHIFLWNHASTELVGAYRLADTRDVLPILGTGGLYTSTLFRFDHQFFGRLGPALELGRSFIRPEYQRQFAPLMMLWRGVGKYVAANPGTPVLFGAVSISNTYSGTSRELMVRFLQANPAHPELVRMVRPRKPFRLNPLAHPDVRAVSERCPSLEAVAAPIADLEPDGKSVPVLLRQYLKLGASVLGFNVDPAFSNALDGLMVVDLRKTSPAVLERYMTRDGYAGFHHYHSAV